MRKVVPGWKFFLIGTGSKKGWSLSYLIGLTLIWSKGKNVENKNEGVGRGTRVRVRAREVSPSIYFHFQHFYLSTKVGGISDSSSLFNLILLKVVFLFHIELNGFQIHVRKVRIHTFLLVHHLINISVIWQNH